MKTVMILTHSQESSEFHRCLMCRFNTNLWRVTGEVQLQSMLRCREARACRTHLNEVRHAVLRALETGCSPQGAKRCFSERGNSSDQS